MERYEEIERSIIKKFRKTIWSKFISGIKEYKLIEDNDKIAVCISGGKDSMLMAKLFQELKRHNKFPFELVFLVMDPGYSEVNRKVIEKNARMLGVPITVFETMLTYGITDVPIPRNTSFPIFTPPAMWQPGAIWQKSPIIQS